MSAEMEGILFVCFVWFAFFAVMILCLRSLALFSAFSWRMPFPGLCGRAGGGEGGLVDCWIVRLPSPVASDSARMRKAAAVGNRNHPRAHCYQILCSVGGFGGCYKVNEL